MHLHEPRLPWGRFCIALTLIVYLSLSTTAFAGSVPGGSQSKWPAILFRLAISREFPFIGAILALWVGIRGVIGKRPKPIGATIGLLLGTIMALKLMFGWPFQSVTHTVTDFNPTNIWENVFGYPRQTRDVTRIEFSFLRSLAQFAIASIIAFVGFAFASERLAELKKNHPQENRNRH